MRIHTDELTHVDLVNALPACDVVLYAIPRGSRSRHHAFEVALRGNGPHHTRAPQTGATFAHADGHAATYSDWGRWLAALFARDPDAIAGPYNGAEDFHRQTQNIYSGRDVLTVARNTVAEQRAAGAGRRDSIIGAARVMNLDPWLLERALFGEL